MSLPIYSKYLTDNAGNVLNAATVTVRRETDGGLASIFTDRAGTTAKVNPFTTGVNGLAEFYVAGGEYRVQATSGATSLDSRYSAVVDSKIVQSAMNVSSLLTANITLDADSSPEYLTCNDSAGSFTITLPPAASAKGKGYSISKVVASSSSIIVDANGGESISWASFFSLNGLYSTLSIYSDGTQWIVKNYANEGTFIPTATGLDTAGTTVYAAGTQGRYIQINKLVTVYGYLNVTSMTGTGDLLLSLPYPVVSSGAWQGSCVTFNLDFPGAVTGSVVVWATEGLSASRIFILKNDAVWAPVQTQGSYSLSWTLTYPIF